MLIHDFPIIIPKNSKWKKKNSKIPQFTSLRNWENSRREKREISSSSFSPFPQKSNPISSNTKHCFFFVSLKKGKLVWGERRTWQKCRCVTSTAPNWVQMKRESWSETLLFLLKLIPKKATPFSSSLRGFFAFCFCFGLIFMFLFWFWIWVT